MPDVHRDPGRRPGLSRTLLFQRLRLLERYDVVERRPGSRGPTYHLHLTRCGQELADVLTALGRWGARWLEVAPEHLDAGVALWTLGRLIDRSRLRKDRVVVRFDFTDKITPNRYWLVLTRAGSEVCVKVARILRGPRGDHRHAVADQVAHGLGLARGRPARGRMLIEGPPARSARFATGAG